MDESAHRLFFALWPPTAVAGRLHDAALAAQRVCGGRAMRRDTLHVTLAFLGAVTASALAEAEKAADAVGGAAFELELDHLSCWKHNRIVWAGCSEMPFAARQIAAALGQSLRAAGFALDARPFAVHATLVRNADCAAALPPLAEPIRWPVDGFALVESHGGPGGPRYEVVRRWHMH